MNVIQKIYEYWPAAKAATVEALYTGGLSKAQVSTSYVRANFPELSNTAHWYYGERVANFLLQPDLFPESLAHPWRDPRLKQTTEGEAIHEDLPFA